MSLKQELIPFLTGDEIQNMIEQIAAEIERDFRGQEVTLIGDLKGAIHFMADLSRTLKLTQQVDFVQLTSQSHYGQGKTSTIRIIKDVTVEVTGKNIILVEEIIDEGRTLNFLRNRILASSPARLKIATLLDKPSRRIISINPDYVGRTIEDRFVVGYGMDDQEIGRNYGEIFYLKH